MAMNKDGCQDNREHTVLETIRWPAKQVEEFPDRLPAGIGVGQEALEFLPHLPHGWLGLGVGGMEAENPTVFPMQPRCLQERLVHAPLRRVSLKAKAILFQMLKHRFDQVAPGSRG